MAYSATAVLPAEVWAETRTDSPKHEINDECDLESTFFQALNGFLLEGVQLEAVGFCRNGIGFSAWLKFGVYLKVSDLKNGKYLQDRSPRRQFAFFHQLDGSNKIE